MKRAADSELDADSRPICINAGGTLFETTRRTLLNSAHQFPHSQLADLASNMREEVEGDATLPVVLHVDTDPTLFRHILQLLRRPTLARCEAPPDVWPSAWIAELEYWGLTEHNLTVEERGVQQQQRQHRRNLSALEQIGAEARAQVLDNEVSAIVTLLRESGYTASKNKSRETTLYVPVDHYKMPGTDIDLGRYLLSNTRKVESLLAHILAPCQITIKTDASIKHMPTYRFGGVLYNAPPQHQHTGSGESGREESVKVAKTLTITLNILDESVCNNNK